VLARRIDLRWLMMFGLACFTLSMWRFASITHEWGGHELLLPRPCAAWASSSRSRPPSRSLLHALRLSEQLTPSNPAAMRLLQRVGLADVARFGGDAATVARRP
jgi:DHA2 family multidrug resistance protein